MLAWLLSPNDFGLIAIVMAISSAAQFVNAFGVSSVLVQRQRTFKVWAPSAFQGTVILGALSASVVGAVAAFVALQGSNTLFAAMLGFVALDMAIKSWWIIPKAAMESQLQFKKIAFILTACAIASQICTVSFAYIGWGALSFVVHRPLISFLQFALMLPSLKPYLTRRFVFRNWLKLLRVGLPMFLANIILAIGLQGDYLVLGLFCSVEQVGIYFFAYSLASQSYRMVALAITKVAFPTISNLPTNTRKIQASARMLSIIAVLMLPVAIPWSAMAVPAVALIFPDKWISSGFILTMLIPAAVLQGIALNSESLIRSMGNFTGVLVIRSIALSTLAAAVIAGALLNCERGVATAVLIFWCTATPVWITFTFKQAGDWRKGIPILFPAAKLTMLCSVPLTLMVYLTVRHYAPLIQLTAYSVCCVVIIVVVLSIHRHSILPLVTRKKTV